jgi:hypothetical protein
MSNLLPQYSDLGGLKLPDFLFQFSNEAASIQVVQSVPVQSTAVQLASEKIHSREDLSVFFTIGIIVNAVMVVAFVVWGFKQWKKNDTTEK